MEKFNKSPQTHKQRTGANGAACLGCQNAHKTHKTLGVHTKSTRSGGGREHPHTHTHNKDWSGAAHTVGTRTCRRRERAEWMVENIPITVVRCACVNTIPSTPVRRMRREKRALRFGVVHTHFPGQERRGDSDADIVVYITTTASSALLSLLLLQSVVWTRVCFFSVSMYVCAPSNAGLVVCTRNIHEIGLFIARKLVHGDADGQAQRGEGGTGALERAWGVYIFASWCCARCKRKVKRKTEKDEGFSRVLCVEMSDEIVVGFYFLRL